MKHLIARQWGGRKLETLCGRKIYGQGRAMGSIVPGYEYCKQCLAAKRKENERCAD